MLCKKKRSVKSIWNEKFFFFKNIIVFQKKMFHLAPRKGKHLDYNNNKIINYRYSNLRFWIQSHCKCHPLLINQCFNNIMQNEWPPCPRTSQNILHCLQTCLPNFYPSQGLFQDGFLNKIRNRCNLQSLRCRRCWIEELHEYLSTQLTLWFDLYSLVRRCIFICGIILKTQCKWRFLKALSLFGLKVLTLRYNILWNKRTAATLLAVSYFLRNHGLDFNT